jgi:hypothetical protein
VPNGDRPLAAPEARETHDDRGRFAKGNPGGPGNPYVRKVAALRHALLEALEAEGGVRRVVAGLLRQLEKGDLAACELLLRWTLGEPVRVADPDSADRDEVERSQGVPLATLLRADAVSLPVALALLHAMQKVALMVTAQASPAGALLGSGGWEKIFAELGDPQLSAWWAELSGLQREAQQAAAREAARKAGRADGGGGTARK